MWKKSLIVFLFISGNLFASNIDIEEEKSYYDNKNLKSVEEYLKSLDMKIRNEYYDDNKILLKRMTIYLKDKVYIEVINGKNEKNKCSTFYYHNNRAKPFLPSEYTPINFSKDGASFKVIDYLLAKKFVSEILENTSFQKNIKCDYNSKVVDFEYTYKKGYFLDKDIFKLSDSNHKLQIENIINKFYKEDNFTIFGFDTGY